MNITQFFLKYNGKYLDEDGVYGAQCVDVIKAYFKEVLGIGFSPQRSARDGVKADRLSIRVDEENPVFFADEMGDVMSVFPKGSSGFHVQALQRRFWGVSGNIQLFFTDDHLPRYKVFKRARDLAGGSP